MAKTIPQLTDATTVNAADELIIQQSGITKRATGAELAKGLNVLNGQFRVSDYGAVGDGSTNDRPAIQAAIDAANSAGGGYVMFDAKTYIIGSPRLGWRSNVILCGTGSTVLKVANGIDGLVIGHNSSDTAAPVVNVGAIGIIFDGNRDNAPKVTATSVVGLDPVDGAYFERCVFKNATGYGMSMQYGTPSLTPNNDRIKNVTFIKCDFNNNGYGVSGLFYDGIDVKNSNGLSLYNCTAKGNGFSGFDLRGNNVFVVGCEASGNTESGLRIAANQGATQNTSATVSGGFFNQNGDSGIQVFNGAQFGTGYLHINMTGCHTYGNDAQGIVFGNSSLYTSASVSGCVVYDNGAEGISVTSNSKNIEISNCHIVDNALDGIYINSNGTTYVIGGNISGNGGFGIKEGPSAGRNGYNGCRVFSNTSGSISLNGNLSQIDWSLRDFNVNGSSPSDIIASASSISLPAGGHTFYVTGTTDIDSITLNQRGRIVTLIFKDVLTVNDSAVGGNLKLAGNFTTALDRTLTLVCNNTNWLEISRSAN